MSTVEAFKQQLLAQRETLLKRVRNIDQDIRHEGMSADWTEQASERENDEVLISLGQSAEQELELIELALQRIANDEYFNCSECGEPINPARLQSLPYCNTCIDCAEVLQN